MDSTFILSESDSEIDIEHPIILSDSEGDINNMNEIRNLIRKKEEMISNTFVKTYVNKNISTESTSKTSNKEHINNSNILEGIGDITEEDIKELFSEFNTNNKIEGHYKEQQIDKNRHDVVKKVEEKQNIIPTRGSEGNNKNSIGEGNNSIQCENKTMSEEYSKNKGEVNVNNSKSDSCKWVIEEVKGGFLDKTGLNLSIPRNISALLSLGPKYVIPYEGYNMGDLTNMLQDIEERWNETPMYNKKINFGKWKTELLKTSIYDKKKFNAQEREIIKAVLDLEEFLKRNKDLRIEQADKGKITILVKEKEFLMLKETFMHQSINKGIYKFIHDMKFEEEFEKVKKSKLYYYRTRINSWKYFGIFINKISYKDKEMEIFNKIQKFETEVPEMKFIIKAHKEEGLKVRNLCPKNRTWNYNLSGELVDLLKDAVMKNLYKFAEKVAINENIKNKPNRIDVKDIAAFANSIQDLKAEEEWELFTCDVVEMYNNIDINNLLNIINMYIDDEKYNRKVIEGMIKYDLIEANWVIYDKKLYNQEKGIPMGSITSTMYAEIYMNYHIFCCWESMARKGLIYIFKYIDDLFLIAKKDQSKNIIKVLEENSKLKFDIKEAVNEEIEFMDMIIKKEEDSTITTRWYKKPYTSNRTMHKTSTQNNIIKFNTIYEKIHRAVKLTNYRYMYDVIQESTIEIINNGYSYTDITNALEKLIKKLKENNIKTKDTDTFDKYIIELDIINSLEENINTIKYKIEKERLKKSKDIQYISTKEYQESEKVKKHTRNTDINMKMNKNYHNRPNKNIKRRKRTDSNKGKQRIMGKFIRIPFNKYTLNLTKNKIRELLGGTLGNIAIKNRKDKQMGMILTKMNKDKNKNKNKNKNDKIRIKRLRRNQRNPDNPEIINIQNNK